MNEPGEIVGMVDVLKLTYATLEQVWCYTIHKGLFSKLDRSIQCLLGIVKAQLGTSFGFR